MAVGIQWLVFIYLCGLEFLNLLLYPEAQLTEHNNGCGSTLGGPNRPADKHTRNRDGHTKFFASAVKEISDCERERERKKITWLVAY